MEILPIAVVMFVVIAVLAIFGWQAEKKRTQDLRAWAAGRGLAFSSSNAYGLDDRFAQFKCLSRGSNRYAENCMSGNWNGRGLLAFDYHYETHSTDSKGRRQTHHHRFSAVIVESRVALKPLLIRPEGLMDKIGEFFGLDDIDFESAEFSRKFYVKSADRRWAFDVIHPRTMEFLLASPVFTIEFDREHVIAYRSSRFKCEEFQQATELACGILDRLPEYVVRQQGPSNLPSST